MSSQVGTCTECRKRVTPDYIAIHGRTRQPFHTAIKQQGFECGGDVQLDQDAELPRHLRVLMHPGQDKIPLGGGVVVTSDNGGGKAPEVLTNGSVYIVARDIAPPPPASLSPAAASSAGGSLAT